MFVVKVCSWMNHASLGLDHQHSQQIYMLRWKSPRCSNSSSAMIVFHEFVGWKFMRLPLRLQILWAWVGGHRYLNFLETNLSALTKYVWFQHSEWSFIILKLWSVSVPAWKLSWKMDWLWMWRFNSWPACSHLTWILSVFFCVDIWKPRSCHCSRYWRGTAVLS
jgi:hypothetical protein